MDIEIKIKRLEEEMTTQITTIIMRKVKKTKLKCDKNDIKLTNREAGGDKRSSFMHYLASGLLPNHI